MVCLLIIVALISLICFSVLVKEPLILGVFLVLRALIVCRLLSFWVRSLLRLVIFLSYVGGVIVLFVYVLRVNPNELYRMNLKLSFMLLLFFVVLIRAYFWLLNFSSVVNNQVTFSFIRLGRYWILYFYIGIVLLFSLLVVCYLCIKKRAPLRRLS